MKIYIESFSTDKNKRVSKVNVKQGDLSLRRGGEL